MRSAVESARDYGTLERRLYDASKLAKDFFHQRGFTVENGNRTIVHPVKDGIIDVFCSDERFALLPGNQPGYLEEAKNVSILGGLYLVMGEVTGGTASDIETARAYGWDLGFNLWRHGSTTHGALGCLMYELATEGKIHTEHRFESAQDITKAASELGVPNVMLPDDHTAEIFSLNYLPVTSAHKTPYNFTHDYWASTVLGIPEERVNQIIYETLTQFNGSKPIDKQINTVQIIA